MKRLLPLILVSCAAQPVWYKDGATHADFEQDKNRCIYEAHAATASYSSGNTARTHSGAVAQGIGDGLNISMRQGELYGLCMRARGYYTKP
jgi:hypothetical protein